MNTIAAWYLLISAYGSSGTYALETIPMSTEQQCELQAREVVDRLSGVILNNVTTLCVETGISQ